LDDNDDNASLVGWILGIAVTLAITVALATGIMAVTATGPAQAPAPAAAAPAAAPSAASTAAPAAALPAAAAPTLAKLYFDTGKVDAPPDAAGTLAPVVEAARARAGAKLVVSGFHDASGDPLANAELAKQRAMSVRAALVAAGVDEARIELRKPQQMAGAAEDREARRVEVAVE
jgi:K(+)-stimulated pyrophosphate-energized sodium pump